MATHRQSRRLAVVAIALCASAIALLPAHASTGHGRVAALANPVLLRGLSPVERAALGRNGFVVTAPSRTRNTSNIDQLIEWANNDPHHQVYWQFYDVYHHNLMDNIPNFVTSDTLLHTFHVIYDQTLVALEQNVFAPKLERLNDGLMNVATYQYGATTDARIKRAALLNLGYVAVAQRLLRPGSTIPASVAPQVQAELTLIARHSGPAQSPLFGYLIDYSQFIPRGHYTGSAALRRYFQAMMWYGRLSFHLNGDDRVPRTRQALLLVRGLTRVPALYRLWAAVFDPITTWVGRSDDLTVRDYAGVMAQVYPANAPVSALASDARLARFMTLVARLPDPRINGDFATSSKHAAVISRGLRLFGQRFTPDSAIMQALIWDKVGTSRQQRLWPLGLDVAAALGSSQATALVTRPGPYDQTTFAHYARQLASIQSNYGALPVSAWHQNLYWNWLNTLRAEWGPVPPASPAFMKTGAWAAKSLSAGLASWAELRHDTLLYVKQLQGLGGGGTGPVPQIAYVEPVPRVYQRLLALTEQLKDTLIREGELDALPQPTTQFTSDEARFFQPPIPRGEQGYRAAIDGFAGLVALAQRVSERELSAQPVSRADMQALVIIADPLQVLTDFFQDNASAKALWPVDKQVAAIADVFTEPNSRQVLEVGVGDVLPIYAIVSIKGQRWLTRGGVYSYYEFHWPTDDRLSDDAWRRLRTRPGLPAWTSGFVTG